MRCPWPTRRRLAPDQYPPSPDQQSCGVTPPGESSGSAPVEPATPAQAGQYGRRERYALPAWVASLIAFWIKINNDWIFNLAGLLAYNLLMTVFPILLLLLAAAGVILGNLSLSTEQAFEEWLASAFPGEIGPAIVHGLVSTLTQSVSLLLLVGLVGAIIAGSRLFVTLENCFGIVFRLRGRGPVRQNLMAIGMLLLYLFLVPVVFLGTLIPPLLSALLPAHERDWGARWIVVFAQPVLSVAVTAFGVGMTYFFVPHRPVHWRTWREIWPGAGTAGVLLLLYEAFFPWYREHFVHVDNYGSIGAFVIVILLFFYYFALILLLGAEINSWAAGQRQTAADLPGMLHAIQVHRTLQGAAGPTAGEAQEEMQVHEPSHLQRRTSRLIGRLHERWRRGRSPRPRE